jgi:hypothetical protein
VANCYTALDLGVEVLPVLNKMDLPQADPDNAKAEIEDVIGIDATDAIPVLGEDGHGHRRNSRGHRAQGAAAARQSECGFARDDRRQLVRCLRGCGDAGARGRRPPRKGRPASR